MKIHLMYSRRLAGKIYPKGTHEVPDALEHDWFFKALVKENEAKIILPEPVEPVAVVKPGKKG
jgi:hypothetical protein